MDIKHFRDNLIDMAVLIIKDNSIDIDTRWKFFRRLELQEQYDILKSIGIDPKLILKKEEFINLINQL